MAAESSQRIFEGMKTQSTRSFHGPREPRLGVDIGRVIIAGDGPDTSFIGGSDEEALRAPEMPGAFEALAALHAHFGGKVWLVSKCGPRIQARTRQWFQHRRFFETTGIAPENLFFCRTRPEKAPICEKLGITAFVDDRWDILTSMVGIVPHLFLFGRSDAPGPQAQPVSSWEQARRAICEAVDSQTGDSSR